MNLLAKITHVTRSKGDPIVLESGPSSRGNVDQAVKCLGWLSIGLGIVEMVAARRLARGLGMQGSEALIRGFGVREILAGMTCLSVSGATGMWSRVVGDGLDLATLYRAYADDNRKKDNVALAMLAVGGITLIDLATAQAYSARHGRKPGEVRDYGDRSGWPRGEARSRGVAAGFEPPSDMKRIPSAADASKVKNRTSPVTAPLAGG